MIKDINEFSALRLFRFVAYVMAGIALYLAGLELNSANLKLAALFMSIGGTIGVVRNLMRLKGN
ncbi:MAG: hypothetical protein IIA59_07345 [Candidatus Marinimicrobia bacterium]|nr:hypothetical protein [Candidatus Neomarinimicrobiota bacterium]